MSIPSTFHAHETVNAISLSVAENAIEIAMHCLEFLQDNLDLGRDAIIRQYILPWAQEAEKRWQMLKASDIPSDFDTPYYEFIDDFVAHKEAEFLQTQRPSYPASSSPFTRSPVAPPSSNTHMSNRKTPAGAWDLSYCLSGHKLPSPVGRVSKALDRH